YRCFFFFQAEDGIRDRNVTGVQTCALPILLRLVGPDYTGPQAIRYPRGGEVKALAQYGCTGRAYDFLTGGPEADTVLVSYGSEIGRASWRERGEESGADTAGQQNSSKVPT